jgi:hypothetical protein
MSRTDKQARRRAQREAFLRTRPVYCQECGATVDNPQVVELARQHALPALCDDCSWHLDTSEWTIDEVFS